MVKPIPDGYHTVTPYLTVRNAAKVIEFLRQGFGAQTTHEPFKRPDGKMVFNPPSEEAMQAGDLLITLGHRDQLERLETLARA